MLLNAHTHTQTDTPNDRIEDVPNSPASRENGQAQHRGTTRTREHNMDARDIVNVVAIWIWCVHGMLLRRAATHNILAVHKPRGVVHCGRRSGHHCHIQVVLCLLSRFQFICCRCDAINWFCIYVCIYEFNGNNLCFLFRRAGFVLFNAASCYFTRLDKVLFIYD